MKKCPKIVTQSDRQGSSQKYIKKTNAMTPNLSRSTIKMTSTSNGEKGSTGFTSRQYVRAYKHSLPMTRNVCNFCSN
jgi:hypothetical protein